MESRRKTARGGFFAQCEPRDISRACDADNCAPAKKKKKSVHAYAKGESRGERSENVGSRASCEPWLAIRDPLSSLFRRSIPPFERRKVAIFVLPRTFIVAPLRNVFCSLSLHCYFRRRSHGLLLSSFKLGATIVERPFLTFRHFLRFATEQKSLPR